MRFQQNTIDRTYRIRLERGEEVIKTLTDFCIQNGIHHAWVSGIGAVERAKIGYYDLEKQEYFSQVHTEPHEVVSMTGNVALVDHENVSADGAGAKPFLHVHTVLSNTKNEAFGGHVFEAYVAVTLEVELVVYKEPLTRTHDDTIGLKLLECRN